MAVCESSGPEKTLKNLSWKKVMEDILSMIEKNKT